MKFYVIDFGDDVEAAQQYATAVLEEFFQIDPARAAVATLINVRD